LKYCKIRLTEICQSSILPFATNEYSSIEQLVIKNTVYFYDIDRLLSYVPQLRQLSLGYLYVPYTPVTNKWTQPIPLNYLTHLHVINLCNISFNDFELLIKSFFCSIKVLFFETHDGQYLNANRWKQLILSSMPFLCVFDIYFSSDGVVVYPSPLEEFSSPFWVERKWYFARQDYANNSQRLLHGIVFYSTNPYRY
jgi:hypothetical protein